MPMQNPPNADHVRKVVEERLRALDSIKGAQETVTVEWRGQPIHIPVISMPVDLLHFNPDTHRIRAQRSMDPDRERKLESDPFGETAQNYLHQLLMGDPTDPSKIDPSFIALKDDLREHGQTDPGIITRSGVLINGNTRRAALKEIGEKNIRVGVLPPDAGHDDLQSIELSLQLRKDHKRDYSFMNFLLAVDERAVAGELAANIQRDFHIQATTYERSRWILEFVREALDRSEVPGANGKALAMRLVDFESHQGKLDELYRAYMALKAKSPDEAEALREQRLLAMVLGRSKTDLRWIEPNFVERYMKATLPPVGPAPAPSLKIPGTSITVKGPSQQVQALRQLTNSVLQAKSIALAPEASAPAEVSKANELLGDIGESLKTALDRAGRTGLVVKKRLAPVDRISDACDDLEQAVSAVADARATGNFDPVDLDEVLVTLKSNVEKLSAIVSRGSDAQGEGLAWIRAIAEIARQDS